MLLTYEATLENGKLIWNEPVNLPEKAKVIVTVIEAIPKELERTTQTFGQFQNIWEHLSDTDKEQMSDDLRALRDSWERPI